MFNNTKIKRTLILTAIIISITAITSIAANDPSLQAWYKFNETSGTTAHDSSGNDFHATINGTMYWENLGAMGYCLSNNRAWSGSYVELPANVFASADQQLTIAFWAKRTDMCNTYGTGGFFKGSASGTNVLAAGDYVDGTSHYATFSGGDSTTKWWWGYGSQAPDNTWHHLAYVWDFTSATEKLYFNGELVSTQSSDTGDSFAGIDAFRFFTRTSTGTNQWWDSYHGQMDDLRIYDRALEPHEIKRIATPQDINQDNFVDFYDVELLAQDWLDDSLGNSDINKDEIVNFKDYAILINAWRQPRRFYFDSENGSNTNPGTSPAQPWLSVSKFNATTFLPGDQVYFKAGCTWTGQIKPKGSGTDNYPIVIDAYGDISDENNKPRFDGNGNTGTTLYIRNVEYWEIKNLQITNLGTTRAAWRKGVSITADNFGTMHHIHLKNLYVHNVNGLLAKEEGGGAGISWFCSGNTTPTKFDDILIEGCHIKTTDRDGIVGGNTKIGMNTTDPRDPSDWYPSTNVIVRANFLEDIGGDGIVPIGTDGCIVEYNVINGGSQRTYNYPDPAQFAAGIWPWSADNTIIQYNEVSSMKGTRDGQGYDCDYNCQNTLFQYNYSHNNDGGFMLTCYNDDGIGNINPIIRYNISQNDKERIFHLGASAKIYNNVIYQNSGTDVHLIKNFAGMNGTGEFKNNIFLSLGTFRFDYNAMRDNSFSNNCWRADAWKKEILWYGSTIYSNGRPGGTNEVTSDPQLINPGSGSNGIDTLDGYKLQPTSPCMNAGTPITNNGNYDFWGNILYNGNPDIGAHEK